jgi:DNA-binding transcriptional ArsR family regulator
MFLHHPTRDELDLPSILHALSDPQRLGIVRQLAEREGACPCYSLAIEGTKSTRTHHLRVLREAGLIRSELVGTSKLNTLRRADLDARFPGLLDAVLADKASLVSEPAVPAKASLVDGAAPDERATLHV